MYGLLRLSAKRLFSTTRIVRVEEPDFTHTIIGAGAVGLAIGAEIREQFPDSRVLIIEKNDAYGKETSSRNSEVVHGGLYYPEGSLKTQLCLEGKRLIYGLKDKIPVQKCGKWIIAQNESELEYLEKLHDKSKRIGVPTEFLDVRKAKEEEPLVKARAGILVSPTTGITSAHSLMDYQFTRFQEADGSLALGTQVVDLNYNKSSKQYEIQTKDEDDEIYTINSSSVINSAGLHAAEVSNMLLPKSRHIKEYYAKGNYFSYIGKPLGIKRLLYPCPTPGVASLGTHLTIDLGGQIRFGPDLEWVDNCDNYKVNGNNLPKAFEQVQNYLPCMKLDQLEASYCGIRPKIIGPTEKRFQDFVIREESEYPGFINLLGIESPGLTASMGIAKYVCKNFI